MRSTIWYAATRHFFGRALRREGSEMMEWTPVADISDSRTFALPDSIDAKGIRAEAKDGVLRVYVPKAEGAKSTATQIEVK